MATVDRGPVKLVVMASGRISANYEVDIKCKASGEVTNLPFDVSDVVKKGSLVLELDPIDEQRAVDQAKAALDGAKCKVNSAEQALKISEQTLITDQHQAETALHSAEINARDLRSKAARTQQLFESRLECKEQAETADTLAQRAEMDVENAKNAIEALKTRPITIETLRNEVTLAKIQVDTAQTALDDAAQRLKETKG
jgi:HlyD family secretion protein